MKNVLVVDDEKPFLLSLTAGMEMHYPYFNILTAEHGKEASQILESTSVDLVVTDLRMPVMDGFELLAYMSKKFPSIPAIVISAYGTPGVKDRLKNMGTLRFIDKPIDFDELGQAINDGLKEVSGGGSVKGISLCGFLQLIEMEQKTCLLEIHSEEKMEKGFFYFNKGDVYDAICDSKKGEEAALEMIGWDRVEIHFKSLPKKKVKKRINSEIISLLMEGLRLKDELSEEESSSETENITEMSEISLFNEENEDGEGNADLTFQSMEGNEPVTSINEAKTGDVQITKKTSTDFLYDIRKIDGVSAVVLVARDGFIIESAGTLGNIDMDMVGASVGIVLNGAERMKRELDLADFQGLTLESDDAMIMCTPVGEALLVTLAPDSKKLGMIRLQIKNQIPDLELLF